MADNYKKLLSIIIPVYNQENNIGFLFNKLVPQLNDYTELIIVNDGSTDSSLSICKKYELENKVIVIDKENGGVSSARNAGLKSVKGEFVCFIDSDDMVADNYIDILLNLCKSNADLVQLNFFNSTKNGYKKTNFISSNCDASFECIFDLMLKNAVNTLWNKIFFSSIIFNNKLQFDENVSLGEDRLFIIDYLMHSEKIYFCKEAVYYYRMTASGLTVSSFEKTIESEKAAKAKLIKLAEYHNIRVDPEKYLAYDLGAVFYLIGCAYLHNYSKEKINNLLLSTEGLDILLNCKYKSIYQNAKKFLIKFRLYPLIGLIRKYKD